MKGRIGVPIGISVLVALSIGVMMASEQLGHRAEVLELAARFLGGDSEQVEGFEVRPAPDEEDTYVAEGSIVTDADTGLSEPVRIRVDLAQEYVARADWPDRMACDPPTAEVDGDRLRAVALAFARGHCPYWTEQFTFERHIVLPANKGTFHGFTWAAPTEAGSGACRVTVGLCAVDERVFRYDCSYVPPEQLVGVAVTEAQALEIARGLLDQMYHGAARITECRSPAYIRRYDALAWYVAYRVEHEGVDANIVGGIYIDARNATVLYPQPGG